MRNQSEVWGKNSASRSIAEPSPLASGKSIIRLRARTSPVERAYPGAVGRPSDIWTPMVAEIRQGARADSALAALGPEVACPRPWMPPLAVAVTPRARAVRPMNAPVRQGLRIRGRVCGMEIAFGCAAAGRVRTALCALTLRPLRHARASKAAKRDGSPGFGRDAGHTEE